MNTVAISGWRVRTAHLLEVSEPFCDYLAEQVARALSISRSSNRT